MELIRRIGVGWFIALGAVVLAFVATVIILNSTLYSASGFVRTYLDALARQDAEGALELAATGPASAAASTNQVLLSREGMGTLTDIEIVEDDVDAAGIHHVVAEYVAGGIAGSTEFEVRRDGSLFGFFNAWSFVAGPFAALEVTVQHERVFTANGLDLIAEQDVAAPYLVFVPSTVELSYESELYAAEPVDVLVAEPGVPVPASVDLEATDAFVEKVQAAVDAILAECTTQRVLQPGGCPFGETIVNRVVTEPTWSIVDSPDVTLVPDGRVATWRMPLTAGTAHLVVDVQSIFDGSIATYDRDVPFTVEYEVVVLPDGEPSVRPYVAPPPP